MMQRSLENLLRRTSASIHQSTSAEEAFRHLTRFYGCIAEHRAEAAFIFTCDDPEADQQRVYRAALVSLIADVGEDIARNFPVLAAAGLVVADDEVLSAVDHAFNHRLAALSMFGRGGVA